MSIHVLIADDQALVRSGFRLIIEACEDLTVVGEASDGVEAIERVRQYDPDVVLMDVRMPNLDGVEATRRGSLQPVSPRCHRCSCGWGSRPSAARPPTSR